MVIVKLQGGLGNQMFIYALCLKLKHFRKIVKLDTFCYENIEKRQLSHLSNYFPKASMEEVHRWQEYKTDIFSIIRRNIGFRKKEHVREVTDYMPEILEWDNIYLDGYWQNELYFGDIRNLVLEFWDKYAIIDKRNLLQIIDRESVSIHIRRGDYLQLGKIYGNICTKEYYEKAVKIIKNRMKNPTFYVFSDDKEWVKKNIMIDNMVYVDTGNVTPEHDMFLMSQCRHNIIANSSYSWWGAWLNKNKDKVVISPKRWFNDREYNLACQEWMLI